MANFGTYYIDAATFSDATTIFTDATFTTVAPDGIYQFNGIHRTLTSGVLGSITFCPTCCAGCSSTYLYPIPAAKNQYHTVCSDVGQATNTAIVIKFKFTGTPVGYPLGLAATFQNINYDGVTSNRFGWLPEKYVGNNTLVSAPVLAGSYELDGYAWQPLTSDFVQTGVIDPITGLPAPIAEVVAEADINVSPNNPDECYLLIPKISPAQNVNANVYHPIPLGSYPSAGGCDITIPCPSALQGLSVSVVGVSAAAVCSAEFPAATKYIMRVNSTSGAPALFDRIFTTSSGSVYAPTGYYAIVNPYSGSSAATAWMRIGTYGVVQAVGSCANGLDPSLTELTGSETRPDSTEACAYQNQSGTNLPDQQYWHDGAGDAPTGGDVIYSDVLGTTTVPDGFYQLLRDYMLIETVTGVVQAPTLTCFS